MSRSAPRPIPPLEPSIQGLAQMALDEVEASIREMAADDATHGLPAKARNRHDRAQQKAFNARQVVKIILERIALEEDAAEVCCGFAKNAHKDAHHHAVDLQLAAAQAFNLDPERYELDDPTTDADLIPLLDNFTLPRCYDAPRRPA